MVKRFAVVVAVLIASLFAGGAVNSNMGLGPGGIPDYRQIPNFTLTDTINVAVGRELNIWYDQLDKKFPGISSALFSMTCDVGSIRDRSFRYTPSAGDTASTLTIVARDINGNLVSSASTVIKTVADTCGSDTAHVLLVGDSLFENDYIAGELTTLFKSGGGGGIVLRGRTETTSADSLNEGHSGASWRQFTSATGPDSSASSPNPYGDNVNPFWDYTNGNLNFQKWVAAADRTGDIDYCIVQLGINDVFLGVGSALMSQANIDTITARIDRFCDALLDEDRGYPYCKIILSLPPTSVDKLSAFGDDYGASAYSLDRWYYYVKNMDTYRRIVINRYDEGAYNANVTVIPTYLWVDPVYGYPYTTAAVNARKAGTKETYFNNYVHPDTTGYWQIADAFYSQLRAMRLMESPINLLSISEDFISWDDTVGTFAAEADIEAPDGKTDAHRWTTTANEREYFLEAVTGQTIAAHNVLSVYFHRETATPLVYMAVIPTAGTTRSAAIVISSATVAAFNSGTTESAYFDFNYEAAANGWVRCWIYFAGDPDGAGATATDVGKAFTVRIGPSSAYTTAARTVGIWGAQFEQGVTTPSAYLQRP